MTSRSWYVDANGNWSTVADWGPMGAPQTGDDVNIDTADLHTITYNSGTLSIDSLHVDNDNFIVSGGALTIGDGGSIFDDALTVSAGKLIFGPSNDDYIYGTFTQSGSGATSIDGGSYAYFYGNVAINAGTFLVGSGAYAVFDGATFSNAGTISATGATLEFSGTSTDTGTLNVNNSTVDVTGTFAGTAFLALLNNVTDSVSYSGATYNNAGKTLSVGTGTSLGTLPLNFTIQGGTIHDAGGGFDFDGGTLDGVTFAGTLDLSADSASLTVTDGLTGTGAATIDDTGYDSYLILLGTESIGNTTIDLGNGMYGNGVGSALVNGGEGVVTLGASTSIDQTGAYAWLGYSPNIGYGDGEIDNDGTITANASGGEFTIDPDTFVNNGAINVSNGDTLNLGSGYDATAFTNSATGSITVGSGSALTDYDGLVNDGQIVLDPSTMSVADLTGTGVTTIDAGSTLVVGDAVSTDQTIDFSGGDGTLDLDTPADVQGTIGGCGAGDTIDLINISYESGDNAQVISGNVLQFTEVGGGTIDLRLSASDDFTGETFNVAPDNASGTDITLVPCYCPGTLILTAAGEVPVEDLAIGDLVMTVSGAARPIKWIGRRSYSGRFALGRKDILPIRIAQGALDENIPRRDLWVSPRHALYLDGVLIEACDLVNGESIAQAESVEQVVYIHIELDTHDVILAESAPAESFIDDDTRGLFHNAHEYRALYPAESFQPARYCAPRLSEGFAVEAARRRIALRAGLDAPDGRALSLRGYVDVADGSVIAGWAQNPDHPEAPVCLNIIIGGNLVGQALANRYRPDLETAGIGGGRQGFQFTLPPGVTAADGPVEVRRAFDGRKLPFTDEALGRRRA